MKKDYPPRGRKRLADGRVIKLGQERKERGFCKRCGLVMDDSEPMGFVPEWYHKDTGHCPNDGRSFGPGEDRTVVPFRMKQAR